MDKVKIGVIGLGGMGERHTKAYLTLPNVSFVGGVEPDPERADKFAKTFGVPVYDSPDKLLPLVDAVSVCTPDNCHKDIILEAFRCGVKVLVEKPLEVSSAACREILAARPDPTFLMVGHILHFDPRVWHIKRLLDSHALGEIYGINIRRSANKANGFRCSKWSSITWFLGIHDIEMLLWLTGRKIVDINAIGRKLISDNWDYVLTQVRLDDGTIACLENQWVMPDQRISGGDAGLTVIGSKGMAELVFSSNDVRITTEELGRTMNPDSFYWPDINGVMTGCIRHEAEAFVRAVQGNEMPPITGEMAAEAVSAVEWIERELDK